MESWNSPSVKMEPSPAESFLSLPGEPYPSLFASATMDPSDIMTPAPTSDDDKADLSVLSSLQAATMSVEPSSPAQDSPASDKKPTKKRKSWGQILPEPKTNLPPRKRAKTDDEKEQRRVERVLRNRRAAQSSRERKRLEVEALEERNKELEAALRQRERECMVLFEELKKRGGVPPKNSVTLSAELFSNPSLSATTSSLDDLLASQTQKTVNPASLSPALTPVPETAEDEDDLDQDDDTAALAPAPTETSPDLAQHPAVSVGGGFSATVASAAHVAGSGALLSAHDLADFGLDAPFVMQSADDADRFILENHFVSTPDSTGSEYNYMAGDAAYPFPSETFDINEFLKDDDGALVGGLVAEPTLHDLTTQASPEDPNQQPHLGASSLGCDVGGLAVGAI